MDKIQLAIDRITVLAGEIKDHKDELGKIVDGMSQLETEMARHSFYKGPPDQQTVAEWVTRSSRLSSRLDKVWKAL